MDHLKCNICREPFDEGSRVPLILPACGHTLCEECASKSIQFSRISCPFDRTEAPVIGGDVKNLNKNFTVLEAIRNPIRPPFNLEPEPVHQPVIHCDEDEHHIATVYCTTCKFNYCNACSRTTHSSKTMSTHKMVKVSEKPETPLYCPQHEHQVADLFCEDVSCKVGKKLMCATCHLYGVHQGHNYKTLDKVYEEKMKQTSDTLENTRGLIKRLKSEIEKVGNLPARIENYPEYINEKNELDRKYQKDSDLLKQRMTRKMNEKREELHTFNAQLDELCILEKTFLNIKSQRKADFFRNQANTGNNIKKNEPRKTVTFTEKIIPERNSEKQIVFLSRMDVEMNDRRKQVAEKTKNGTNHFIDRQGNSCTVNFWDYEKFNKTDLKRSENMTFVILGLNQSLKTLLNILKRLSRSNAVIIGHTRKFIKDVGDYEICTEVLEPSSIPVFFADNWDNRFVDFILDGNYLQNSFFDKFW